VEKCPPERLSVSVINVAVKFVGIEQQYSGTLNGKIFLVVVSKIVMPALQLALRRAIVNLEPEEEVIIIMHWNNFTSNDCWEGASYCHS